MTGHRSLLNAGDRVENVNLAVGSSGGNEFALWMDGNGIHRGLVCDQPFQLSTSNNVPQT
jgi:hypothetical protein